MKKLMIAFAAVAMGFAANAATANWTLSNVYAGDNSNKAGGYLVYAFVTASTVSGEGYSNYAYADAVAALEAGDTTFLKNSLGSFALSASGAAYSKSVKPTAGFDNGTAVSGYLVVVDSATPSKAYITSTLTATTGGTGTAAAMNFGAANTTTSTLAPDSRVKGNWYTVPEPCSGLLMLVGMGALALRRRRA